jgi:hypothetical protein
MTTVLDQKSEQERRRLELFRLVRDPASIRRLERTGVGGGWRCLEIGAGRRSIADLDVIAGATPLAEWSRESVVPPCATPTPPATPRSIASSRAYRTRRSARSACSGSARPHGPPDAGPGGPPAGPSC